MKALLVLTSSLLLVVGSVGAFAVWPLGSHANAGHQELACGRLLEYRPPPSDNLAHGYGHVRLSTATGDRAVLFHHVNPSNTPSRTEPGATQMGADICISGPYEHIVGSSPYVSPYDLRLAPADGSCAVSISAVPTRTVYLPNVTKTLGGADGWQTPFIVQNTGSALTTLEVTFYRFSDGACVARRVVSSLFPGTSFADIPNNDSDLPGDTQFAVVIRSFGSPVVAVVNGHAGAGVIKEALSYVGTSVGATSVFLPNITRRFFGYVTPFIIQNLGTSEATVTATFRGFDGSTGPAVVRRIPVGGSKFVDPNSEPGLMDGKQYSVTVTSAQPVSVVVNSHNDAPGVADPVAYSTNGIAAGAPLIYGPYAAKNGQGAGHVSTIVVQNMSSTAVTPRLDFAPLGATGPVQSFTSPTPVAPGAAWAFDPRFTLGTTTPCTTASATCLGEGEYSFVADSTNTAATIAVAVNVISPTTAGGYTGLADPMTKLFAPNVTRVLGGPPGGWTTPILLQSVNATGATLEWRRFSDGQLVLTQAVQIPAGRAIRIDPRDIAGLSDNTQYSVVITGTGGPIAAVVRMSEIFGDAAFYEAFAESAAP